MINFAPQCCVQLQLDSSEAIPDGVQGAYLVGEDLYMRVEECLRQHVKRLTDTLSAQRDNALLDAYLDSWERFNVGMKAVNHIFNYLNRFWVKRKKDEGATNIHEIKTLAIVIWQETLFGSLKSRLRACILNAIAADRAGQIVNRNTLRGVISSIVALGINSISLYREEIEIPFLDATEQHFSQVRILFCFLF